MNSKLFKWSGWDLLKGAVMAALGVIFSGAYQWFSNGQFPTTLAQWKPVLITGLSAFVGYMLKNLFTNSAGQLLASESTPAAQALAAAKKTIPALQAQTK
jgi:hypothetical protein